MGWRDRVKLAGKLTKRLHVWRIDVYSKPYASEGDYDTVHGLNAHRWRSDWDYKIQVGRSFMTRREFGDWAKNNSQMVARKTPNTNPQGVLTRSGFPNHLQNVSRWQTEGRLPWGEALWCGRTIRAVMFGGLRSG